MTISVDDQPSRNLLIIRNFRRVYVLLGASSDPDLFEKLLRLINVFPWCELSQDEENQIEELTKQVKAAIDLRRQEKVTICQPTNCVEPTK